MRKVETRIKVITKGDEVEYIPQMKGCNLYIFDIGFLFYPSIWSNSYVL